LIVTNKELAIQGYKIAKQGNTHIKKTGKHYLNPSLFDKHGYIMEA
jgi:hypothetical protein